MSENETQAGWMTGTVTNRECKQVGGNVSSEFWRRVK